MDVEACVVVRRPEVRKVALGDDVLKLKLTTGSYAGLRLELKMKALGVEDVEVAS